MGCGPVMERESRVRIARWHRWAGLVATVPLTAWVVSSFVLHGVGLTLPETGLRGEYALQTRPADAADLSGPGLIDPGTALTRIREDGLDRVYWLRLQSLGGRAVYVAKPGPFALERVYDAETGERMDPLDPAFLRRVAGEELVGTAAVHQEDGFEFNRYYAPGPVPAAHFVMEGTQPSELVVSRASGRTLTREDPRAGLFEAAYRKVHVFQWGPSIPLFSALLYGLVGVTLVAMALGTSLWIDRRRRARPLTSAVRRERRVHAWLAPWAAVIILTQMLVGAYLWYNLGLIEPRFRGQGSFQHEWTGGLTVHDRLRGGSDLDLASVGLGGPSDVHALEWRRIEDRTLVVAYPVRDDEGVAFDGATGRPMERLTPEAAGAAADAVVLGRPVEYRGESREYWMDYNRFIPTYLYRFDDPDRTDVHVSQITGEVIQRRPEIWRRFGPFLVYHTFAFTGNPWLDTLLLGALQLTILVMVFTGWRMARPLSGLRGRTPGSSRP